MSETELGYGKHIMYRKLVIKKYADLEARKNIQAEVILRVTCLQMRMT